MELTIYTFGIINTDICGCRILKAMEGQEFLTSYIQYSGVGCYNVTTDRGLYQVMHLLD